MTASVAHQGTVLSGKYRLLSILGQGGMGSVWRAEHMELAAPVAIKLIDPSIARNPEALARFQREAKAAATLRSPHVVQILDYGVDATSATPFIAMELMEGESLASRLERGPLAPRMLADLFIQVARALTRAHGAGIVHRDLKPDNIFLVKNDDIEVAKVLDFGIAKAEGVGVAGAATATGMVMGTAYYMSPEQVRGTRDTDFRTDLWAMGVIAHEALTGRRPFESQTLGDLVLKICMEDIPPPSNLSQVPPGFDAWFARAVDRDPARRFQSAKEMAEALRELCESAESPQLTTGMRTRRVAPEEMADLAAAPATPPAGWAAHASTGEPVRGAGVTQPSEVARKKASLWWIAVPSLLLLGAASAAAFAFWPEGDPVSEVPAPPTSVIEAVAALTSEAKAEVPAAPPVSVEPTVEAPLATVEPPLATVEPRVDVVPVSSTSAPPTPKPVRRPVAARPPSRPEAPAPAPPPKKKGALDGILDTRK